MLEEYVCTEYLTTGYEYTYGVGKAEWMIYYLLYRVQSIYGYVLTGRPLRLIPPYEVPLRRVLTN